MKSQLTADKAKSIYQKSIQSGKVFYFLPALYLSVLLLFKGFVHPSGYYRLHYLFTYDHGHLSRGLVGEVMSWFFDTITDEIIQFVIFGCCIVMIIFSSLCFGRALNKTKDNTAHFTYVAAMIVIMLVMPTSFSMQFESITLDKFIWTLTIISLFFVNTRFGIWIVPFLCVLSTLINPIYVFGSMVLIAIVLLQKFYSEGFSFKLGAICLMSYIGIIVVSFISASSTGTTGFSDTNEMLDFYYQRFAGDPLSEDERALFANEWLFEYFLPLKEILKRTFHYYFVEWGYGITIVVYSVVVILPITSLFSALWINAIKNSKKNFQKFIYVLCLIAPIVIIPAIVMGWEIPRYYTDSILVQLSLLIFYVSNKNEDVTQSITSILHWFKQHMVLAIISILHFTLLIVL